ncbi:YopJ/AvrA family T3SS effector serine/threonine acetyltransferase [Bartonella machadoae]|uniref:YopJ/AvrA family T3SS effector serine/threonine acetyltransferase n=1 Tax=Bartonella machadoae TaxID=2893471 RepID=UPI001F4CD2F4|nr:YopJ/AvrA family T3SS effector serine/threonine acetyltransferase [Bartonella machadoae]UNE55588.1 YopJ family type III secretion system effector serine/threonine acetyltransferase [Bartonella machadoae]
MKPQDSKSSAQSLSQTQEDDITQESLESLLARLAMTESPTEEPKITNEKLKEIIKDLEKDLTDGSWLNKYCADIDLKLMPDLVAQANRKHEGLNLKLAMSPEEFASSIKDAIDKGIQSSRYLVNTGMSRIHFATIDHKTIDNKTSLILLEPTTCENIKAARLVLRTQTAVNDAHLPNCYFSVTEMDIQRSSSECGIFCLALAKKLHTNADKLIRMHQDNVNGVLCEPNTPLPSEKLDQYLPAGFYKHTQGTRRLREYIKSNPETENEKVNKKGETLRERFDKNLVTTEDDKMVSVSPHRKRISEYKSLMMV